MFGLVRLFAFAFVALALAACGGGGGGNPSASLDTGAGDATPQQQVLPATPPATPPNGPANLNDPPLAVGNTSTPAPDPDKMTLLPDQGNTTNTTMPPPALNITMPPPPPAMNITMPPPPMNMTGGGNMTGVTNMTSVTNTTSPQPPPDPPSQPDHPHLGQRTAGTNSNANFYRHAAEFKYQGNDHLQKHNFHIAYSRGWTGNGSLVVIADTGADTDHSDLAANIAFAKDFRTGLRKKGGMEYGAWHGTVVAGLVAARKDGEGMHGAAFDAKLAIAKIGHDQLIDGTLMDEVLAWAKTLGADVANFSFGMPAQEAYINSLMPVLSKSGEWYSTDPNYGKKGWDDALGRASLAKAAADKEIVLVVAAGNNGSHDYSYGLSQMATATNKTSGRLILDGRVIVAGWWWVEGDESLGNKAGNVCTTWDFDYGICRDAAKIKDYFILADGSAVSTWNKHQGASYSTPQIGSSISAPIVASAVAIIHQMWPHMKGNNTVQLLLKTADKTIRDYDENKHGQGLLDMAAATNPVGTVGIPTSGRTNGTVIGVSGTAALSTSLSAVHAASLGGVMLLDEFERDFYIDLNRLITSTDTRSSSVAEAGGGVNYYAGYMNADQHALLPMAAFGAGDKSRIALGLGSSRSHVLGNKFDGIFGTSRLSHTLYGLYQYGDMGDGFFAQVGLGVSRVEFDKADSLLDKADPMVSSTATLGYGLDVADFYSNGKGRLGVSVSQPVTLESARLTYNVPVARTLDGRVVRESRRVDFKAQRREIDFGINYALPLWDGRGEVASFAEARTGAIEENRFGLRLRREF